MQARHNRCVRQTTGYGHVSDLQAKRHLQENPKKNRRNKPYPISITSCSRDPTSSLIEQGILIDNECVLFLVGISEDVKGEEKTSLQSWWKYQVVCTMAA